MTLLKTWTPVCGCSTQYSQFMSIEQLWHLVVNKIKEKGYKV